MEDYKKMYLMMMQETEKAVRILVQAQRRCEDLYIEEEERPCLLSFISKKDQGSDDL